MPYQETALHGKNFEEPPPNIIDGEEEWEVEEVWGEWQTGQAKKLQYLIHWKGYADAYDSWELATDMHAPDLIREYKNKKAGVQLNVIDMDPPLLYGNRHPLQHYLVKDHELSALTRDYIKCQVKAWSWNLMDAEDAILELELIGESVYTATNDIPPRIIPPLDKITPSMVVSMVSSLLLTAPTPSRTMEALHDDGEDRTGEGAADFRPTFIPGPEHPGVGWRVARRSEPYSFEIPFEDGSRGPVPYLQFIINQREQPVALGTEGRGKPQYYKPLYSIPMPAHEEAGTPAGHSLALFSKGHVVRNEVDRALTLVVDLGAAADVHRFCLSMRRKQDLFARMRDLDIAWNNWLAEAEGVNMCLRLSNITSHIYPFLPQPLLRGLDVYHINEPGSNNRRFRTHLDHLDSLVPLPIPP
ncbi:hypothetical protein EDB87DRAFT_1693011 [Lactarius vividus]|nr:hypothetical protein EDB87DRAFT_1693011 [Lactarius vividus]